MNPRRSRALEALLRRARAQNPLEAVCRRSLARTQWWPAGELRRYQDRRLRVLVRWAALRSPFYRRWFAESGVDPASIHTLDDLPRLPLLGRAHLVERPEKFLAYPRRAVWPAHTSGTSGEPATVFRTLGSSIFELAILERQLGWFGIPRGARSLVLRGRVLREDRRDGIVLHERGANQLLVSSYHLVPKHLPTIWEAIREFRPQIAEGWPSSLSLLARLLADAGLELPLSAVAVSSERLQPRQREVIERVFGPIVDRYGQVERVAMAGSCEAGAYHVFSEYGVVELLPVDGAPGVFEIVGTPLHNWGFPLFRYQTGDQVQGELGEGSCGCGRAFPLIGRVEGRSEELVQAADGRPIPVASAILDDLHGVRAAQLVQHRPGDFEVLVTPADGFRLQAVEAQVRDNVARIMGPGQSTRVTVVDEIPRSGGGKLTAVRVERPRQRRAPTRVAGEVQPDG